MSGWIKLHRALKDWQWYDDHNATRLLIHLLISVNYEDKKWKGIIVESGSMILSWNTLSISCKMSVQQCRTAMSKLISSKEVTKKTTNKYQVISLVKWEQLQLSDDDANNQLNRQVTGNQQASNRQVTTTKESKEYKKLKNIRTLQDRDAEFLNSLHPFLEKYGNDMLNAFYLYWTEKKPKGRKMRFEMEKVFDTSRRLAKWSLNKQEWKKEKSSAQKEKPQMLVDVMKQRAGIPKDAKIL